MPAKPRLDGKTCQPKDEGGLGLRRVKDWNDATIMKHIWNLFYRKDFIWVAWVREFLLRQGSIWNARTPSRCSWSWRKILQLRDRVRPFIRHQVWNGIGTFLWHDYWNPLGPILPLFGERILYDSAIHRNARVADVMDGNRWNWPVSVSADLLTLKNSCADYSLISIEKMLYLGHNQRLVFLLLVLLGTALDIASLRCTGMLLYGSPSLLEDTPSFLG